MVYLIGGRPRSGKSTIRKRAFDELKIEGMSTDLLREVLTGVGGINPENSPVDDGPRIWPFLDKIVEYYLKSERKNFLVEGDVLLPTYLAKYSNSSNVKVCYIGYSNVTVREKVESIRIYDSDEDFTLRSSNEELEEFVRPSIEKSLRYKEECAKLGVMYFDIETDFGKSIENVIKKLFG